MDNRIQIFEDKKIRTAWDEEAEEWYFSVVDVVGVLTDSKDPTAYWRKLKQRLKAEGNETVRNCHGVKMTASDGKKRMTDVVDTTNLLRLIQSIPSSKAEHPQGLSENIKVAKRGGNVAKIARQALETETGKSAITSQNATELNKVVTGLIENVVDAEEN